MAGADGADGKDGTDGKDGETPYIGSNGNWWIGATDTGVKAAGSSGSSGTNGSDGKDGSDGADGENGKDGVGIQSAEVNENGDLIITLTDGIVHNAGKVVGEDGVTPQLRISDTTNEWEVSYDSGKTWTSLGVKATGESGSNG